MEVVECDNGVHLELFKKTESYLDGKSETCPRAW